MKDKDSEKMATKKRLYQSASVYLKSSHKKRENFVQKCMKNDSQHQHRQQHRKGKGKEKHFVCDVRGQK